MNLLFHSKFFFPFLFFLLSTFALKAQDTSDSQAKIKITSNYDSFYVLVGDSVKFARLQNSNEIIKIESGLKKLWVIPPYSNPFSIEREFISDSTHVVNISFQSILDQPSEIFLKTQKGESSLQTLKNYRSSNNNLISSFRMFSEEGNQTTVSPEVEYSSTYLKVNTNVDSLFIKSSTIDGRAKKIANGDSILVKPGYRTVFLSHQKSNEITIQRTFRKSFTTTIEHTFKLSEPSISLLSDNIATEPAYNANLIIVSDNDSEINVNGTNLGTGAVKLNMRTGPVYVRIENKNTGSTSFSTKVFNLDYDKTVVLNTYTKPILGASRFLSILPGASQVYKRQRIKGRFLTGGFLLAGFFSLQTNNQYNSELSTFNSLVNEYNNSTNEQETRGLGNLVDQQREITKDADNKRLAWFTITGAIYAFNLYDAFFTKPEGGYRTKTDIDFYLNNEIIDNNQYTTFSLSYGF